MFQVRFGKLDEFGENTKCCCHTVYIQEASGRSFCTWGMTSIISTRPPVNEFPS